MSSISNMRKQLLLMNSQEQEGPWCIVKYVKLVEIISADPRIKAIVQVKDSSRQSDPIDYVFEAPGKKIVNIPRGLVRVLRLRGDGPITAYAYSE